MIHVVIIAICTVNAFRAWSTQLLGDVMATAIIHSHPLKSVFDVSPFWPLKAICVVYPNNVTLPF